jgi:uncharacterized lipoprotein YmbA
MTFALPSIAILVGGALTLGACGQMIPPPRLYVLSAEATHPAPVPTSTPSIAIGVNPTSLPDYLDRSEIVVRDGPNEIRLMDSDRWAERLSLNVSRVVASNLAALLPAASLVVLPTRGGGATDFDVNLDLIAFEADPRGNCTISGRWIISNFASRTEIAGGKIAVNESAGGSGDYAAVAAAMSRGLAKVSGDIATAIKATPANPKARLVGTKEARR